MNWGPTESDTFAGAFFGMLLSLLVDAVRAARRSDRLEAREFFELIDRTIPQWLRRRLATARSLKA